jgi:hypothetical protein
LCAFGVTILPLVDHFSLPLYAQIAWSIYLVQCRIRNISSDGTYINKFRDQEHCSLLEPVQNERKGNERGEPGRDSGKSSTILMR